MLYRVGSSVDDHLLGKEGFPASLTSDEYDALKQAIEILDCLWCLEEAYDVLLQNAVEFETDVARLVSMQRLGVSSFPDEGDVERRLLNRRLINFLASARAYVDSVQARFSREGGSLKSKIPQFQQTLSEQYDKEFSYRFMEALRNFTQHRASAIDQNLTMSRSWRHVSGETMRELSVQPQIDRDDLLRDKKIKPDLRAEIVEQCDHMIDVLPHLRRYARCFGSAVDKARTLLREEHEASLETYKRVLQRHLDDDEWGGVWITPEGDPTRTETLMAGVYDMRRLEKIRLRNTVFDPVGEPPHRSSATTLVQGVDNA